MATNAEGEEEFEVEVHIRQLEPQDNDIVKSLIFDGLIIMTMNKLVLNNMERPYILCFVGISAIIVNWLTGGLILSLVISVLCIPFALYIFLRYGVLIWYKSSFYIDVTSGMYKYWSEADSGRYMWVAECNDRIVGCVAVQTVSPLVARLDRLCVEPEWQCMGIGGRLANYAMDRIKQRQFKEVIADAYSVNPEAANLFNKMGFKILGSKKFCLGMCKVDNFTYKIPMGSRGSFTNNEPLL